MTVDPFVCTRASTDAMDATCIFRGETFTVRAGPAAYRAGAGSWARTEGSRVTITEQPIYSKYTPPPREWSYSAATPAQASADATALGDFLTGTSSRVEVSVPTSPWAAAKMALPVALVVGALLAVWAYTKIVPRARL